MNMVAVPSIVVLALLAWMSTFGAIILSKPWMKLTALGIAILEVGMAIFLVIIAR